MTWDPGSSEVIRIHMVPPRFLPFRKVPSIAILNGQELLPLNEAWAILFTEFANAVNAHGAGEMSEEDLTGILDRTFAGVKKVYPQATDEMLKEDLLAITDTFRTVARGEIPEVEIGGLSLAGYAKNMTAPAPDGSYGIGNDGKRRMALQSEMSALLRGGSEAVGGAGTFDRRVEKDHCRLQEGEDPAADVYRRGTDTTGGSL